ncbi:MurR/RpiR family transcriptional regulator [Cohnella silvisoli]|uniref:MurR/RpiR family transcriptional regulator n=1 Tax=Cohnella silvisoli TaxID=2873699 RepID=A0ABV1KYX9_9BACL|nr:MurR/RpiR family transcriptional regulator [Cohnella silvisoli]MCD9021922.1 MurR/RpiR family transcriptional regulator [Cohnella silvisoli]
MDIAKDYLVIIKNLLPSMHQGEKKIAEYILSHPADVINTTIAQLAILLSVADSSIVRFCRLIGLNGFTDLKINLAKNISKSSSPVPEEISLHDDDYSIALKVFSSSIQTLQNTINTLDKEEFHRTVQLLLQAKRIEIYGVGTSATLVQDAYYRFMRIGLPAYAATDPHISRISASMLDDECVALGISHTGRTKDTIETLQIAKGKGAKIIGITSFYKTPLLDLVDSRLVISSIEADFLKEAVSSRIAHLGLIDSLCTCLIIRRYKQTEPLLDSMTYILNQLRY